MVWQEKLSQSTYDVCIDAGAQCTGLYDQALQTRVFSLHVAFMATFGQLSQLKIAASPVSAACIIKKQKKKRKVYAVRRHDGSLCTQKQPETCIINLTVLPDRYCKVAWQGKGSGQ